MKFFEAYKMGLYNLRRALLRTILTTLGVIIGIGTLSSMISFGAGMEKNITNVFKDNDLFTSLFVTSKKIDLDAARKGDAQGTMKAINEEGAPLNDSTLKIIKNLDLVEIAFPEISFVGRLELGEEDVRMKIKALPEDMKNYPPFNDMLNGRMIEDNGKNEIVLSKQTLKRLKVLIKTDELKELDTSQINNGYRLLELDSIIGSKINLVTALVSVPSAGMMLGGFGNNLSSSGFRDTLFVFEVVGVLKEANSFGGSRFSGGAIISLETSKSIPRSNFKSMWDVLGKKSNDKNTYNSFYVRASKMQDMDSLKARLDNMNFHYLSLSEQLDDIKRGFMIVDAILAAIGIVSLIIAALGIINTMVMSILERKKEIGIMKAIGGGESDIRSIFFVEASIIGTLGGVLGLLLGWLVTLVANLVINSYITSIGDEFVSLFSFPLWLIGGAMVFSISISLIAGLYPAYRAARIDPVEALRHE
jgi:putative ABC transport system permease protein